MEQRELSTTSNILKAISQVSKELEILTTIKENDDPTINLNKINLKISELKKYTNQLGTYKNPSDNTNSLDITSDRAFSMKSKI